MLEHDVKVLTITEMIDRECRSTCTFSCICTYKYARGIATYISPSQEVQCIYKRLRDRIEEAALNPRDGLDGGRFGLVFGPPLKPG